VEIEDFSRKTPIPDYIRRKNVKNRKVRLSSVYFSGREADDEETLCGRCVHASFGWNTAGSAAD